MASPTPDSCATSLTAVTIRALQPSSLIAEYVEAFAAEVLDVTPARARLSVGAGATITIQQADDSHAQGITGLMFEVSDPAMAETCFLAAGARQVTRSPRSIRIVEVYGTQIGLAPTDGLPQTPRPEAPRLHHVNLLCHDLHAAKALLVEALGLRPVLECTERGGGWVMLAGSDIAAREVTLVEIMGPPHLEDHQFDLLHRNGPHMDHLCFTGPPVERMWRHAIAADMAIVKAPAAYRGMTLAWLRDGAGVHVELLGDFPRGVFLSARAGGPHLNLWSLQTGVNSRAL